MFKAKIGVEILVFCLLTRRRGIVVKQFMYIVHVSNPPLNASLKKKMYYLDATLIQPSVPDCIYILYAASDCTLCPWELDSYVACPKWRNQKKTSWPKILSVQPH